MKDIKVQSSWVGVKQGMNGYKVIKDDLKLPSEYIYAVCTPVKIK